MGLVASTTLTPSQRTLRARAAAYALHAQGKTNTGPATVAQLARFERQVDPDGALPPDERARRAEYARKSYMTNLCLKASRARRARPHRQRRPRRPVRRTPRSVLVRLPMSSSTDRSAAEQAASTQDGGKPRMATPLLTEEALATIQAVHLAAYHRDRTPWRSNGPRTAAEALLWDRGKMDAQCSVCGEGMAATAWCFRCYGPVLEYVSHADQAGSTGSLFCGAPDSSGPPSGLSWCCC